jgi:hypothetical protein
MGLDIIAYRQLKPEPPKKTDEEADEEGEDYSQIRIHLQTWEWTNKHFPGRTEGLNPGTYARNPGNDPSRPWIGNLEFEFHFRAGSYSGYNHWRNSLAQMASYNSQDDVRDGILNGTITRGPFLELIYFADNEGYIGPVVAAKLAKDFEEWHDLASKWSANFDHENHWMQTYDNFHTAFRYAADGGAVEFC